MRKLDWNEEYSITFENDFTKFSRPVGKGWSTLFEARDEKKRLEAKGFKNIKIVILRWT